MIAANNIVLEDWLEERGIIGAHEILRIRRCVPPQEKGTGTRTRTKTWAGTWTRIGAGTRTRTWIRTRTATRTATRTWAGTRESGGRTGI